MQVLKLAIATLALAGMAGQAQARDQMRIVGSSTVFPFATTVAEKLGAAGVIKTPIVESTGTGGGIKQFCAGVGLDFPDIAMASRPIKKSEIQECTKNGVTGIVEAKIGYDGIVIANSKNSPAAAFTRREIFLALAQSVPQDGKFVPNAFKRWDEIDSKLPKADIEVMGPPPTSGTRDAFVEMVIEQGCNTFSEATKIKDDKEAHAKVCKQLRGPRAYIDSGENDNLIVQKLAATPSAFGVFGYSFLEQNADKVQAVSVDGVTPSFENIASGKYPVSRPLFLYVKKAHVGAISGIKQYITEFLSDKAAGQNGYLLDKGLIPMTDAERKEALDKAMALTVLSAN